MKYNKLIKTIPKINKYKYLLQNNYNIENYNIELIE